jgi:ethanolamine utilization protein EutN
MILARVVCSVVSTMKHSSYQQKNLFVVRPVTPEGEATSGCLVAVDTVGAGTGDTVLVASEGRAAAELLGAPRRIPVRSIIVGIVDTITQKGKPRGG